MVKKLYKHEFTAWLRIIVFFWAATILAAIINRVVQLFENDSVYYTILFAFSMVAFVVGILCTASAPLIFGIVRFYKNFFTGEGYLTFTLPATKEQLLWVKVSTAVCFSILSFLVCLLSGCIIMSGELFTEICKAAAFLLRDITDKELTHLIGWGVEVALLLLISDAGSHLFYYTCICIGQTFRKNRILAAVGVYFAFYVITQVLSTVFSVALAVLGETGVLDGIGLWISEHVELSIHLGLSGGAVLSLIVAVVYWLICRWVLRKKLNLE